MKVNLWAIAVVTFNVGLFVVLIQVLRVTLKLPRWMTTTHLFFKRRHAALRPLQKTPQQVDRLNQLIFNSNQKLQQRSKQAASILQFAQLGTWVTKRWRK